MNQLIFQEGEFVINITGVDTVQTENSYLPRNIDRDASEVLGARP